MTNVVLKEAKRLWDNGFAVHWLKPGTKMPVESGWTSGPRKDFNYLKETYFDGLNIGTRLGEASKIGDHYLSVIDVDIKSNDDRHRNEAIKKLKYILKVLFSGKDIKELPVVLSGRGGGSRHYYFLSDKPFKTWNPFSSKEIVKVLIPSKTPSKKELETLTSEELKAGYRLSRAWEISFYNEGRQVVLPPSIHPDTKKSYVWKKNIRNALSDLPKVSFEKMNSLFGANGENTKNEPVKAQSGKDNKNVIDQGLKAEISGLDFNFTKVDLSWLPISDRIRLGIETGEGVTDRSGFLLFAANGLLSAGLEIAEILSILTDRNTFIGSVGFEHAKTNDRKKAAEWVYKYTIKKVKEERDAVSKFKNAPPISEAVVTLSNEEIESQNQSLKEERHWTQDLEHAGPKGNGPYKSTIENVVLILENAISPKLIERNTFSVRDTFGVKTPWGSKKNALVNDDDEAQIKLWLGQEWGFEPPKDVIRDALTVIACKNSFDPVRNWLDTLEWDKKPRLNVWLKKYFQAQGNDEYLNQVFTKWLVAMVLRIYQPGAKFDWMPIFEGAQGIGKSSFGRMLVGDKYFSDSVNNLADKDSVLGLQGMWVIELGELSQFRKNELETIKAFLTRTVDKIRPPYGRRVVESARRCVFFGTTNKDKYLKDDTGNRRFKPVVVGNLNFKALKRDRDQLFAEARHLLLYEFMTELDLELDGEAKEYEKEIHQEKTFEDDSDIMKELFEDFIKKVVDKTAPINFDFYKFRISDLFLGAGPLSKFKHDHRNVLSAVKMLKKFGGENRKINGVVYWKIKRQIFFTKENFSGFESWK